MGEEATSVNLNVFHHCDADAVLNADSVETTPYLPNRFALGTYQLDEAESVRRGTISLYSTTGSGDGQGSELGQASTLGMNKDTSFDVSGVFDLKWDPQLVQSEEGGPYVMLGHAAADGSLNLYRQLTTDQASEDEMVLLASGQRSSDSNCLSLDWNNRVEKDLERKIVTSYADGSIAVFGFANGELTCEAEWLAHDFEAWIVAFNPRDPSFVFSGSDDTKLKGWDLRCTDRPTFVSKRYDMGVCSIQWNPLRPHHVAIGSYDESIKVWDSRAMAKPLCETSVGGGVWRLKHHPTRPDLLLCAGMYNGFHVINVSDEATMNTVASYMNHKSIAYGVDWLVGSDAGEKGLRVASCSFYDHSLHLWEMTEEE